MVGNVAELHKRFELRRRDVALERLNEFLQVHDTKPSGGEYKDDEHALTLHLLTWIQIKEWRP